MIAVTMTGTMRHRTEMIPIRRQTPAKMPTLIQYRSTLSGTMVSEP
jgi:hypothetical protein